MHYTACAHAVYGWTLQCIETETANGFRLQLIALAADKQNFGRILQKLIFHCLGLHQPLWLMHLDVTTVKWTSTW